MADDQVMHDTISSSSDDDDDDFQGIDVSEFDIHLINQLEAHLEANPSHYDAYVQFIQVLRRCNMKERLREVRRAMQSRFPLSEALWLDWITDEMDAVQSEQDIKKIEELLEVSHNDYLSVDLWIQHIEYVSITYFFSPPHAHALKRLHAHKHTPTDWQRHSMQTSNKATLKAQIAFDLYANEPSPSPVSIPSTPPASGPPTLHLNSTY